ncbi:hypothetical protein [Bacillus sp. 2205SS5-2]|uniref:hypothetical protein n=1 Tax=Bacillus sp. 2205SS5-2 TaxID=3109031 RepID=UPI00300437AC
MSNQNELKKIELLVGELILKLGQARSEIVQLQEKVSILEKNTLTAYSTLPLTPVVKENQLSS